jgi:hypothetical protein
MLVQLSGTFSEFLCLAVVGDAIRGGGYEKATQDD